MRLKVGDKNLVVYFQLESDFSFRLRYFCWRSFNCVIYTIRALAENKNITRL